MWFFGFRVDQPAVWLGNIDSFNATWKAANAIPTPFDLNFAILDPKSEILD
jgi:hypothetical protein